jgi:phosphatidylethanolamine/phosphatidyl-N-methylethanolamine N-methyltransferase
MALLEPVTFLRQTFSTFHTTGAVAPSSSALAKAMVKCIPDQVADDFKVLEVGAGTGSFTAAIASRLNGRGEVHAWEINSSFAKHLEERIATETKFHPQRGKISVRLGNILDLKKRAEYNAIISGLPFNNFTPEEVRVFLEHFRALLKPGGTLAFFEYAGIRKLQQPFVGKKRRTRLQGIASVVDEFARESQYEAKLVWWNLPPARARHLRFK